MHFLLRLLINGIVFYALPYFVQGIHVKSFTAAIIAALIFGIVNAIIRPIMLLLTLPLTIMTLGLFVIVINAVMFWLVGVFYHGIRIDNWVAALIGSIVMMIVSLLTNHLFRGTRVVRTA